MIPSVITQAKAKPAKPVQAVAIQNATLTADNYTNLRLGSEGKAVIDLGGAIDLTKYPLNMRVLVTGFYAGEFTVSTISSSDMTLIPVKGQRPPAMLTPSDPTTGTITPIGPVPVVNVPGTYVYNGKREVVAISYTGNQSFLIDCNAIDSKMLQIVAISGSITSATVLWSLDGVNFHVFNPAITGTGTIVGLIVPINGATCTLRLNVVSAGTYYVMEG